MFYPKDTVSVADKYPDKTRAICVLAFIRRLSRTADNLFEAQFTHNIFAHNIEIKRYCNKKIKTFFSCVN